MSTLQATNLKNASSASNNIVLDTAGNATVAGTMSMGSSYLRNRIINGDMRIDQRNAGAAVTINSTAATYTLDRWMATGQSTDGVFTVQQSSTAPSGFNKSALITVATADASVGASQAYMFNQFIEGFNVGDLNWGTADAQSITLSFYVRSSLTGTFGGALNNSNNTRSYPFSYTISSANTWELKSITIPGDTSGTWLSDSGRGITVRFSLGVGSTQSGSAGSWSETTYYNATGASNVIATNGATWYITGVQLEPGTVATPFERRQYGQELALCQRYYEKSYPMGVVPGSTGTDGQINFAVNAYTLYSGYITYQVTKRASTTITVYNTQTGASGTWYFLPSGTSKTVVSNRGTDRYWEPGGANTWPAGEYTYCNWTASAEL